jgi:RimJ/RimL family protein N-acetyltransferase
MDAFTSAPLLTSERLRLRGHSREDFARCAELWADPQVTRFIGGRPFTREESWARLLRYAGHWILNGYGFWVIEEKATGRYIGEVGFADHQRDITPSLDGMPEIGWMLAPEVHGRGYATEAVRTALFWGDAHLRARHTSCLIHPENVPSLRIAEKCGYRILQPTTYKGHPTILLLREVPA